MLASLKRVFQGDRDSAAEQVTSQTQIVALLYQLKAAHELLGVTVPGHPDQANTAILGIREKQNRFYLDELSSPAAHKALLKQRKARIQCRLQGMELKFTVQMTRADTKNGIALYEFALPKSISRVQRRDNFRLRLSPGLMVPASIAHFEGKTVGGEAFDLSESGVGLFLNTRDIPSRGQILHELSLSLPHTRPLTAGLEVRFARLDNANRMLRIGGRFVDLERKQERLLAQFLAEQQRKLRRHGPR